LSGGAAAVAVAAAVGPTVAASGATPFTAGTGAGPDWGRLRARLGGDLVLPSETGYAQAKQVHFSMYDSIDPAAVAYCESVADVRTCLSFAQCNGVHAVPRSGGHSFGGFSTTTGLVIDVSRLNGVSVGPRTTTLGPGAQTVDVIDKLAPYGLGLAAGLHGSVAAGGFVHGGGIGWQTRSFGVASDALVSAQVVLADGRVVTASETSEPDLFWALRGGGGGNFGIVTRYERRPVPVGRLVNFRLAWNWVDVERVIEGWQQWAPTTPWALGSRWLVAQLDSGPGGAAPAVTVDGAFHGSAADLAPLLDALVGAVGRPVLSRTAQDFSFRDGMLDWFGCTGKTVPQCHTVGYTPEAVLPRNSFIVDRSRLFRQALPVAGIGALLAAFEADPQPGQLRFVQALGLGGKANTTARTATAYVHRDAEFTLNWTIGTVNPTPTGPEQVAARGWIAGGFGAIDPYSLHETYQNYIDPELPDWRSSYYAENYSRLASIKHGYDPHGFFRFAQGIT
jgi:FAD/FMN-containing dehydrogenase